MRVPEFVAGRAIVEVKRVKFDENWNISEIVRKACEKAHKCLIDNERIHIYHICYVIPESMTNNEIKLLIKLIKMYTRMNIQFIKVKKMNIVFAKAPESCFVCSRVV
tara:strand:- start:332 stop:652 length:321 start_codon:yes stop_codon:yes gene_type:complete